MEIYLTCRLLAIVVRLDWIQGTRPIALAGDEPLRLLDDLAVDLGFGGGVAEVGGVGVRLALLACVRSH